MSFSAILFDLDGTLIDSLPDIADCANRLLTSLGYPTHPYDAYRYFVGDGITNLIARALPPEARTESILQKCISAYRADYAAHWNVRTRPYPEVPAMLNGAVSLHQRLAILSNKPHDFTLQCVDALLATWRFDVVLGASHRFPHKPDPAAALHIARTLDLPPAQFLYVGDTATDMQTAVAAGMHPVGALWGYRTADELHDAGARSLIARPSELLALI